MRYEETPLTLGSRRASCNSFQKERKGQGIRGGRGGREGESQAQTQVQLQTPGNTMRYIGNTMRYFPSHASLTVGNEMGALEMSTSVRIQRNERRTDRHTQSP